MFKIYVLLFFKESFAQKIKSGSEGQVLLAVEHFPVYTVGIRRKEYDAEYGQSLKKLGADFVQTNRGGLITFHGPGTFSLTANISKMVSFSFF